MSDSNRPLAWLLLGVLSLIWGSSFILIELGLDSFSGGQVGALRILAASIFLSPLAIQKLGNIKRHHWPLLVSVGLLGSLVPSFLFAIAQTNLDSSVTGILNALTPLFTVIIGALFFAQKFSQRVKIGLVIGFVGSIILIMTDAGWQIENLNLYAFLVVFATTMYGANLNLIKFRIKDLKALDITSISLLIVGPPAGIYLFFFTDFVHDLTTVEGAYLSFTYVAVLGIVGTAIALIIFNNLVKISSPIFTSSVTYIIPVVAVALGVFIEGDILFIGHYLGMLTIIGGVYLANRKK
ncbi:MAG: DMT family transporter [Bacteroidota bacterium]